MSGGTHVSFRDATVTIDGIRRLTAVTLDIPRQQVTAVIGPAGGGKSTLLRCINRTVEVIPGARVSGLVLLDGQDVMSMPDVYALRRRVGMVSPLPVGLPLSVYDNVAYASRLAGVTRRQALDVIVERSLRQAALWDEVKDRLSLPGTRLSGGQQQRLAIARALSHSPEVLCLNRFSIAIDPLTTMRIEQVLHELKSSITIVLATNLVPQARRLADTVAFMDRGCLIESGPAAQVFGQPANGLTSAYVQGHIG